MPTLLTPDGNKQEPVIVPVTIARCNGLISMLVNGQSRVVEDDLGTSDGVIQVVDKVLLPQGNEEEDASTVGSRLEQFKRDGLPSMLWITCERYQI